MATEILKTKRAYPIYKWYKIIIGIFNKKEKTDFAEIAFDKEDNEIFALENTKE
jgi:hypothetical protein